MVDKLLQWQTVSKAREIAAHLGMNIDRDTMAIITYVADEDTKEQVTKTGEVFRVHLNDQHRITGVDIRLTSLQIFTIDKQTITNITAAPPNLLARATQILECFQRQIYDQECELLRCTNEAEVNQRRFR